MGEINWDKLPTAQQNQLITKLKLPRSQVIEGCADSDIRLFDSEDSFWDWYLDADVTRDLFHDLRLTADKGALRHGSVQNYARFLAGVIHLGSHYYAFSNVY